ncbi:unnamed protein product [Vitrella brassicaformis CCMP3155]|uniref:BTB domain-containing protein n=1 Tax=Vitrella brassicaformis (strain CCMP3155) TaxID=1169540 RepID=A0A0G4FLW8_VITBC|nr:unnamed protein product [Vitrella brassicaformis CCMP3155]|eukprot:CEM14923.1 unnamed protein product [Vitrella brassicaformis CCMP3155]
MAHKEDGYVKLIVGLKKDVFYEKKSLLVHMSPFFDRMLEGDMACAERETHTIALPNIHPNTFRHISTFATLHDVQDEATTKQYLQNLSRRPGALSLSLPAADQSDDEAAKTGLLHLWSACNYLDMQNHARMVMERIMDSFTRSDPAANIGVLSFLLREKPALVEDQQARGFTVRHMTIKIKGGAEREAGAVQKLMLELPVSWWDNVMDNLDHQVVELSRRLGALSSERNAGASKKRKVAPTCESDDDDPVMIVLLEPTTRQEMQQKEAQLASIRKSIKLLRTQRLAAAGDV